MDLPRKIGVAIVSLIPAFVLSGLVWDAFKQSWLPVGGVLVLVFLFFLSRISEKGLFADKAPKQTHHGH